MPRFRTLTARFGTFYASIIAIVLGVCIIFILSLTQIQRDSNRVMEETREQGVLMRAISGIEAVQSVLSQPEKLSESEVARAAKLLAVSINDLGDLEGAPDDPSRPEHQNAETRLSSRLIADLQSVVQFLEGAPDVDGMLSSLQTIAAAKHNANVLFKEAQEESEEADLDLDRRVNTLSLVIVGTLLAAFLLLGGALLFVNFGIARPLRTLQAGAERFGKGELKHRIRIDNSDEMGELAKSLNGMADRLADSQEHLEERVRSRTREFLRAARLADLGLLASGIAHEINTPLASIASCAEGLERRHKEGRLSDELLLDYSGTIRAEVYRARGITTRMLALVRLEPSTLSKVPLRVVMEQAASAVRHRASASNVQLTLHVPADDVELHVNAGELVQIIVNLITNALDASPPRADVAVRAAIEGEQVILTVEDHGTGIPEEDLDRIFEPFHTSKPPGEGTGLGLALVGTMVESHHGSVSVKSELGIGSSFSVTLPKDWGVKS